MKLHAEISILCIKLCILVAPVASFISISRNIPDALKRCRRISTDIYVAAPTEDNPDGLSDLLQSVACKSRGNNTDQERISLLIQRPKFIKRHPKLVEHIINSNANILSTKEWFARYLKLTKSDAKKIQSRWPNSYKHINSLGRHKLKQWLTYFISDLGLTNKELKKIMVSRPDLLSYKLSNIQSTASFFCDEVGLSQSEFKSMITSYPSVLRYSVSNRLRPHIDFLQNEIGGGKDNWKAWKKVVLKYPQFFSHSLEKTLLPKVGFFCDKERSVLCLKKAELSQVVAKFPPTLWSSDGNLEAKFEFLAESLELVLDELRSIVVSYPQILGLSLENNLKPKMAFFLGKNYEEEDDMDGLDSYCGLMSKEELRDFVLFQPALLAYSLEGRLKPRIQRMEESGISFRYCPKNIMSFTEEKFEQYLSLQSGDWTILN